MQPVYAFMNRFSLIFHALLACIINFTIEAISRHSLAAAWNYMTGTPLVFLYNAFMIFVTFSIVYLFKRRIFVRIIISALWIILGIANGYILLKRVTPFNAQDLKIAGDGIALINNYCNGFEVVVIAIGAVYRKDTPRSIAVGNCCVLHTLHICHECSNRQKSSIYVFWKYCICL